MANLIEDGKKKIKDLDSDALAEDINSKFKNLHIMAIEYSQAVARAGLFLSCAHVSVGQIAIFKNLLCYHVCNTLQSRFNQPLERVPNASASL